MTSLVSELPSQDARAATERPDVRRQPLGRLVRDPSGRISRGLVAFFVVAFSGLVLIGLGLFVIVDSFDRARRDTLVSAQRTAERKLAAFEDAILRAEIGFDRLTSDGSLARDPDALALRLSEIQLDTPATRPMVFFYGEGEDLLVGPHYIHRGTAIAESVAGALADAMPVPGRDILVSRSHVFEMTSRPSFLVMRETTTPSGRPVVLLALYDVARASAILQSMIRGLDGVLGIACMDGYTRIFTSPNLVAFDLDVETAPIHAVAKRGGGTFEEASIVDGVRRLGHVEMSSILPCYVVSGTDTVSSNEAPRTFMTYFLGLAVMALVAVGLLVSRLVVAVDEIYRRQSADDRDRLTARLASLPGICVAVVEPDGRIEALGPETSPVRSVFLKALGGLNPSRLPSEPVSVSGQHEGMPFEFLVVGSGGREDGRRSGKEIVLGIDATTSRARADERYLVARLVALGEMSAGIGHELSHPISIIRMAAHNALVNGLSDTGYATSALQRILKSAERASAIIEAMRDLVTRQSVPTQAVSVSDLVDQALDFMDSTLTSSGVVVDVAEIPYDLVCLGDESELVQVMHNLLVNARDAIEMRREREPMHEGHVRISAEARDENVVIRVRDNGIGIDETIADRIFDPFFTTKGPQGGTGLGLSISHNIVRRHNGTIVGRRLEDGTLFEIVLPRLQD